MTKKFDTWATYHRKLLEKGVQNHNRYLKKQDLHEYDQTILEARKNLSENNLIDTWNAPLYLKEPIEFLFLNEQLSSKIPKNVMGTLRTQINALKRLRNFFVQLTDEQKDLLNAAAEDETKTGMNFEEELRSVEEEINKIFTGGFFQKAFGYAQRLRGSFDDTGKVQKSRLAEEHTTSKQNIHEVLGTLATLGGLAGAFFSKRALEKRAERIETLQKIAQTATRDYGFDRRLLLPISLPTPPPLNPIPVPKPESDVEEVEPLPEEEPTKPSINIMAGRSGTGLQSIIMSSLSSEMKDSPDGLKVLRPQITDVLNALQKDLKNSRQFSAVNEAKGKKINLPLTTQKINVLTDGRLKNTLKTFITTFLSTHGFMAVFIAPPPLPAPEVHEAKMFSDLFKKI